MQDDLDSGAGMNYWPIWIPTLLAIVNTLGQMTANYFVCRTMIRCRHNVTWKLQDMYMNPEAKLYFVMNSLDHRVDNCDQRITNDQNLAMQYIFEFFYSGVLRPKGGVVFNIAYYVWLTVFTFKIMNEHDDLRGTGLDWMVFGLTIVTFLGCIIPTMIVAKKVTNVQERQQEYEAEFRVAHARVRGNAESIAFYNGNATEKSLLNRKFQSIYMNLLLLARRKWMMDFIVLVFHYGSYSMCDVISVAVCMKFGSSVQGAELGAIYGILARNINRTLHALLDIMKAFNYLVKGAAFTKRVMKFQEVQEEFIQREVNLAPETTTELKKKLDNTDGAACLCTRHIKDLPPGDFVRPTPSDIISIRNANIYTPDGTRCLLTNVNLEMSPGESILILGPSGIGKSSLLRVLGNMWPLFRANSENEETYQGETEFHRPDKRNIFFLAQKPYMIQGTLREQIAYPFWDSKLMDDLKDSDIERLFTECNLEDVWRTRKLELDNTEIIWRNVLSLGEQQRLQFCRLLWHYEWHVKYGNVSQGFYCVLDEATAALDTDSEMKVYQSLAKRRLGFLSVALRPTVIQYHTRVMLFEQDQFQNVTYRYVESKSMAAQVARGMTEYVFPF